MMEVFGGWERLEPNSLKMVSPTEKTNTVVNSCPFRGLELGFLPLMKSLLASLTPEVNTL